MTASATECFDAEQTVQQIAQDLKVTEKSVRAAVDLFDEGNTIPFIARYRKEVTQGLDEIALRAIEDALAKARELAARKSTVLGTIEQQGQLTPELRALILACSDRQTLEDLYLPFKPKRQTRATQARQRGLEPLAEILLKQQPLPTNRRDLLLSFVDPAKEVPDADAALQGACDIVAEVWSEDVETRRWLTEEAVEYGRITSAVKRGKKEEGEKFEQYFDYGEPVKRIPSHRLLAMKRGEAEGILRVELQMNDELVLRKLQRRCIHNPQFAFARELETTVVDCYERLLQPAIESVVLQQLKEKADEQAIQVFATNLRELLLAPPAGPQTTIGIDPGFRTGCKVAVVDGTGRFLTNRTIYPTPPRSDTQAAAKTLCELIEKYDVRLIAIGNGTASRETDAFVADVLRDSKYPVTKVMVSESGASIYSASELAAREYPDLDVTVRGAISIAHRLQDPLAELVKIDPKSIGVGQYQHDVNQTMLRKSLDREVESCVNSVGVDVNLASPSLLTHVAGIGAKLAERIVQFRDENGAFTSRAQLLKVPKLGAKAYQQAAGFLRIRDGQQPLDNSAVHPESYYVVEAMASRLKTSTRQLVGNQTLAAQIRPEEYVDQRVGLPTVRDILTELAKPGRDPRREFQVAKFDEAVHELEDLKAGMVLEGVVTNVTHFGAFVDLGVHQDGLIHISQLANTFVQDPNDVVKVGDIVRVKVLEVDKQRRRIALSRKDLS